MRRQQIKLERAVMAGAVMAAGALKHSLVLPGLPVQLILAAAAGVAARMDQVMCYMV